jgi:hypothetical protein
MAGLVPAIHVVGRTAGSRLPRRGRLRDTFKF